MDWDWESRKSDLDQKIHTYPLVGLVIHEALQNAVDSFFDLERRKFIKKDNAKIDVVFNLETNTITVKDNGTGIHISKLNGLLKTNFSPKGTLLRNHDELEMRRALKGSQGIGIKLAILCTKSYTIRTVYDDEGDRKAWELKLDDWFDKLRTAPDAKPFKPGYPKISAVKEETGTTLTYQIDPEFMHQESGNEFTIKRFILELIKLEIVRQSIIKNKDGEVVHVSKENKRLPDYNVDITVAELLTKSLIHGGTTRYLLDLNHALIKDDDSIIVEAKIEKFKKEIETLELVENVVGVDLDSDQEERMAYLSESIKVLKRESEMRKLLFKAGHPPPEITLDLSIDGDAGELTKEVGKIIDSISDIQSVEEEEEEALESGESKEDRDKDAVENESAALTKGE